MFTDVNRAEDFLTQLTRRPRRNRITPAVRALVRETDLQAHDMVWPIFVREGTKERDVIKGMADNFRLSPDLVVREVEAAHKHGIRAVMLFPVIPREMKDPTGSEALNPDNLLNRTVRMLKRELPDVCVIIDIALDPYTSHGHDGLVNEHGHVLNDETVRVLSTMATVAAGAGVDIVAPSDMMDGRIGYIRHALDRQGYTNVGILAYAAKYASAFYGPFRDILDSAPAFGDKKTYQMDPANVREALLECALDEQEGADMLLIKPALAYLDVIAKVKANTNLPVGGYHVSGEYAMIMAAAAAGCLDADRALLECMLSIKRAGASFIPTYAAPRVAKLLK
ncbi:MAG: porphobilinogen synthase [Chlamydiales bacterium]|nr:porphobilinogen synthase [Chlamydiales bacterium]